MQPASVLYQVNEFEKPDGITRRNHGLEISSSLANGRSREAYNAGRRFWQNDYPYQQLFLEFAKSFASGCRSTRQSQWQPAAATSCFA
jgi:hypothetical protein